MRRPPDNSPVVLAVLDDAERSAVLQAALTERGWRVLLAQSCEQARTRARQEHIDVLLTDLVLADGSAFGLLRSLEERPHVTAVLTSGNQAGIRERLTVAGFDLQLVRPISSDEIHHAIWEGLERHRPLVKEPGRLDVRPRG